MVYSFFAFNKSEPKSTDISISNLFLTVLRIRDFIPDPDFYPPRILDLGSRIQQQ
jgi:hypothetical protein